MLDLIIVLFYFTLIFIAALQGRVKEDSTVEEYFLSNRSLRWSSIALSTIATNINGYQFLGMMGSAYLYGIAQASLEINAIQGILLAAFIFVPFYLKEGIITISQFIKKKLGPRLGLFYALANLLVFSTITLGAALFWGAYAADIVFEEYFVILLGKNRIIRVAIILISLGVFSAIYTYLGGLNAVVKTDIIQFSILLIGGFVVLFISLKHLGGWNQLYEQVPEKMHLYLPKEHPKLPWIHLFGLFFLNINYWCANQTIIQRSLAARSLRDAQIGLMFGGIMKYVMAVLIVVPGVALFAILGDQGLAEPDMAFPYIVKNYLPIGLKGIILCALFASLMSTVDSTFNSLATIWSIDVYKEKLRPLATDKEIVAAGKKAIIVSLVSGIVMGLILLYFKFNNPEAAFTHSLNELRYFINCGIVVLIVSAVLAITPNRNGVLIAFLITVPLNLILKWQFPEMNYFFRAFLVILFGLMVSLSSSTKNGFYKLSALFSSTDQSTAIKGWVLFLSLVVVHLLFR